MEGWRNEYGGGAWCEITKELIKFMLKKENAMGAKDKGLKGLDICQDFYLNHDFVSTCKVDLKDSLIIVYVLSLKSYRFHHLK